MIENSFINYLSGICVLSNDLKDALGALLVEEQYKPHQILFAPGQFENRLCFIESGLARNYYYDEHEDDHTVKFWRPGDIILSYQGYWSQPAYFYTELIDHSRLVTLKYDDLRVLITAFPEASLFIKNILKSFHEEEHQKQRLAGLNAEKRFREMKKNNRLIFQKVPLKIIASYLNMSRETLSRIISKG
jgi:CRP-like cAMP-binding protein